jgi:hypothetical protein
MENDALPEEDKEESIKVGPQPVIVYHTDEGSTTKFDASLDEINQIINGTFKNVKPRYLYMLIHGLILNGLILAANILIWR